MKSTLRLKISQVLLLLFALLTTNLALAQQRGQQGPPPVPDSKEVDKMVEELSSDLSLTKQQHAQISILYKDHFTEVRRMVDITKGGRTEADRKKMDALKKNFEADVNALLTKQQQKKFKSLQKKQAPGGQGKGRRPNN